LLFQDLGARKVVADFSGGTLSSDGGVLFLRQVDLSLGLTRRLAGCFGDQRQQIFVEHSVPELLAQRIYTEALGYEDLNDHQQLRYDPLLATACGKTDPPGRRQTIASRPAAGCSLDPQPPGIIQQQKQSLPQTPARSEKD
jgi:hypothetical protein